jgi:hypothetical protein
MSCKQTKVTTKAITAICFGNNRRKQTIHDQHKLAKKEQKYFIITVTKVTKKTPQQYVLGIDGENKQSMMSIR